MKERIADLFKSFYKDNRTNKFKEQLDQRDQILTYLYDLTEKFGITEYTIKTDFLFDQLRSYKSLILTSCNNPEQNYRVILSKSKENARYISIFDDINKGIKRAMTFNEIFNEADEPAYSLVSKDKQIKIGERKYIRSNTFSDQEQEQFLKEVDKDEAKINTQLSYKKIAIDFAPPSIKN